MPRIVHAALASVVVAVTLAAAAGAAESNGTTIDLSTDEAVAAYLASRGIDPSTVVIQRGLKNYAGPACPGADWNCTTSTKVVQVAQEGGETRFECDPEGAPDPEVPPLVEEPDVECFVVADAEDGNAHGRCVEKVEDLPGAVLYCDMTLSGENTFAHVDQTVIQREGADQDAEVAARVTLNAAHGNHLQLDQTITQSTDDVDLPSAGVTVLDVPVPVPPPVQRQSGTLTSEVTMNAGHTNVTHFVQDLNQRASTGGVEVDEDLVRRQEGDHFGDVDQNIFGDDSANKFHAHQSERQIMEGGGRKEQIGPEFCCATQAGGDPKQNELAIHQDKFQKCEEPKPEPDTPTCEQHSSATGQYSTPGGPTTPPFEDTGPSKFHILHHLANNVDRITARESGPGAHFVQTQCHSVPPEHDSEPASHIDVGCASTAEDDEDDDVGDGVVDFIEFAVPASEWP